MIAVTNCADHHGQTFGQIIVYLGIVTRAY
jgi:hypothetical protein